MPLFHQAASEAGGDGGAIKNYSLNTAYNKANNNNGRVRESAAGGTWK